MRLDKFLKNSRIIKRRTVAKEACEQGRVIVNGRVAKAGTDICIDDEIVITFGSNVLKIQVAELLESQKKDNAEKMYNVIS